MAVVGDCYLDCLFVAHNRDADTNLLPRIFNCIFDQVAQDVGQMHCVGCEPKRLGRKGGGE